MYETRVSGRGLGTKRGIEFSAGLSDCLLTLKVFGPPSGCLAGRPGRLSRCLERQIAFTSDKWSFVTVCL